MRAAIVTGYVPIIGHPRSAKEYGALGENIFAHLAYDTVIPFYNKIEDTWLYKMCQKRGLPVGHPIADNPEKNSLAYMQVIHQKFLWMLRASRMDKTADTFVWIDYGIGHVPGVTAAVIDEFMAEVKPHDFAIPGIWPGEFPNPDDTSPCWRFCGGLMVVPRYILLPLYLMVASTVQKQLEKTGNLTWEVNTLARLEPIMRPKPRWYLSDHNSTMFTNYGVSLCEPLSLALAAQSAPTSMLH